ncbi:hypothetical protein [Streptomyces bambusae]|uniref:Uncharacterized protein n=1 Tax=Streptomyces bambusae TaxID=1550616 RepID=A0ABS6ZE53_9ACTN|nr:hypothetical protein [Streptomyces bambusae]MBW5485996.1 hypothetical protein [Streptomyces bambusae]
MDPEIAALAGTAGTTLVALMATDVWQSTRDGVVELWRRVAPERARHVSEALDCGHEDLLAAEEEGDGTTRAELEAEWAARLRRLLTSHPDLAADLRTLLALPATPAPASVTQHATASGSARIYQAGRDIYGEPR